ncbi:MAG: DUF1501 domain-containing protein [Planctomycetota bacterium]|nr:DUF1501 domain-containing protein [Planctomycetota bacterium]MDA1211576.1 DUF1501 domain-containing protein [Planctomycetota bacterium]
MQRPVPSVWQHPRVSRRTAIQAGAIGLMGLGMNHVQGVRELAAASSAEGTNAPRACVYIFLSGGLAQSDSFDLKPAAPADVRGEFDPIATASPGVEICEHLPLLAQRSKHWSLCRSLTHSTNGHTLGHYYMLTGRSGETPGFSGDRKSSPTDFPSIASTVGYAAQHLLKNASELPVSSNNLPPSVVLPETLVHWSGGVIPGQFGGQMGYRYDPWFIEASPYNNVWKGAYPEYNFPNLGLPHRDEDRIFRAPNLQLPHELTQGRFNKRLDVLKHIEAQQKYLDEAAATKSFGRLREGAISILNDGGVQQAFDVTNASDEEQDRYGRNSYGWSMLMTRRLIEAGVTLVQVNLGNNETWDTHGDAFPRLKDKLFPPTDKALAAFLDDLIDRGLLENTLIVMAGEFGRTPKISESQPYKLPGRDHWGAVQTVFFAGGGINGGSVVGSSDKNAAYPAANPQRPDDMAATIYDSLGIPRDAVWLDEVERPHQVYYGVPIAGL